MNSFKNLNISINEVKGYLEEFALKGNGNYQAKNIKDGFYQFFINIPGNKIATLNIFETKNGLTISPNVGVNQELSLELATEIANRAEKVKTSSQSFDGINENIFDKFLEHFKEEEKINVQEKANDDIKRIYRLDEHRLETTVTYFKTNHKVLIQGKNTKLFKDIVLWFAGKLITEPEEIIKIVFHSLDDFNKYPIDYSDNLIESELKNKIGQVYDKLLLQNEEKKWLKVSFYLFNLKIALPEYYHTIAGPIKVIEGVLTRILLNKCGTMSFSLNKAGNIVGFAQFTGNCQLDYKYKKKLNNNQIQYIENLYSFIKYKRHELSHNRGFNPKIIQNKNEAEDIFNEIINLIKGLNDSNIESLLS